ncbi:MAG: hypothetical protein WBB22_06780 [Anaerolineae bacterium]
MSNEQKMTSWKEDRRYVEAVWWAGALIWAGLVFGADALGYLPQIGQADAWSWVFFGAGASGLVGTLWRAASPEWADPTTWDYIGSGILLIIGVSGTVGFVELAFPLILVLVGVAIVVGIVLRRS